MKTRCFQAPAIFAVLALLLLVARLPGAAAWNFHEYPCPSNAALTCVMSGLDSPRGLAFGPEGALYVAEAGRGGAGLGNPADGFCCFTGPLGVSQSFGRTGGLSRLSTVGQERVATGLPSMAMANGNRGTGAHDVSFLGRGGAYVTLGLEADPAFREALAEQHPDFPDVSRLGWLVQITPGGERRYVADVSAYERAHNPDGRLREDGTPWYDSNPYGVLAEAGRIVVTDAGANTLLQADASGLISLLAVFHSRGTDPPRPSFAPPRPAPLPPFDEFTDAVPTAATIGPDGAYYVSELTGVPFVDGTANIYRVVPGAFPETLLIDDACVAGFKMIIDIAFDGEGNLLVLQHATGLVQQTGAGMVIKVSPDQSQSDICAKYRSGTRTTLVQGLTRPMSIVAAPDGALYVTNSGIVAGTGEVVRIAPAGAFLNSSVHEMR
jgi:hypothetical protein